MSEFDSILRVALKHDTVFDGLRQLAQQQGCSLRSFLTEIAKRGAAHGEDSQVKSVQCDARSDFDAERFREICEQHMKEAQQDSCGYGKN